MKSQSYTQHIIPQRLFDYSVGINPCWNLNLKHKERKIQNNSRTCLIYFFLNRHLLRFRNLEVTGGVRCTKTGTFVCTFEKKKKVIWGKKKWKKFILCFRHHFAFVSFPWNLIVFCLSSFFLLYVGTKKNCLFWFHLCKQNCSNFFTTVTAGGKITKSESVHRKSFSHF